MTIFKASVDQLDDWSINIERELDLTQALAADPHQRRKFRLIGAEEFVSITGATTYEWKQFVKQLREAGELATEGTGSHNKVTLKQVHDWMDAKGRRPKRPAGVPRAIRLASATFKGGASKSTTALHVGVKLAIDGYRVLFVDLDGQATLSRYMAIQPYKVKPEETFAASIGLHDEGGETVGGDPLPLQPLRTFIDGIDIVPAGMAVTSIDMEILGLVSEQKSQDVFNSFERALLSVDGDYDFVIMDFQPSFSLSQLMILFLADGILIPIPTETADFAGTGDFLHLCAKWLGELEKMLKVTKTFDPVLALHTRSKLNARTDKTMSEDERQELESLMLMANSIYGSAGKVFGNHRPYQVVEDRQVVSKCLSWLKSVYEADSNDYDMRAIKIARSQYDAITGQVMNAVRLRWAEIEAAGGNFYAGADVEIDNGA